MRALLLLALAACATTKHDESAAGALQTILLPDAPDGGAVLMDYLGYDAVHHRVWVPAGNTGNVDVIDTATQAVTRIDGFDTAQLERNGKTRTVGPSSVTFGEGVAYVGNRGDSKVCTVDAASLNVGACRKVDSMPDGLAYVKATHEVWVTTPRDHSIRVLDAAQSLAATGKIDFEGDPEGYAVDDERGMFFTNLEDKDRTLAVDLKTRKVVATWEPGCGEAGPRGLVIDRANNLLVVACTDHLAVLDVGHGGKVLATLPTGAGVDNLDYVDARREVYAAAGGAATLTVAKLAVDGTLTLVSQRPTAKGARNAVVTEQGVAYVADSAGGAVLVLRP
jgi:DNA-binding beta-propeller fold protein YncE